MCAIAVGTSHFSANRLDRAMEAYREALALAIDLKAPRLIMQAELAIATTHLTVKDYPAARAAYGRTYLAAAGLPTMQIEALRMQGEGFIGEQNSADAVLIWLRALDEVEPLEPMVAGVTSYRMLGKRLEQELAGSLLMERIKRWALAADELWPTSYGHVVPNRPWYERLGFRCADPELAGPELQAIIAKERAALPEAGSRVVMRYQYDKPSRSSA